MRAARFFCKNVQKCPFCELYLVRNPPGWQGRRVGRWRKKGGVFLGTQRTDCADRPSRGGLERRIGAVCLHNFSDPHAESAGQQLPGMYPGHRRDDAGDRHGRGVRGGPPGAAPRAGSPGRGTPPDQRHRLSGRSRPPAPTSTSPATTTWCPRAPAGPPTPTAARSGTATSTPGAPRTRRAALSPSSSPPMPCKKAGLRLNGTFIASATPRRGERRPGRRGLSGGAGLLHQGEHRLLRHHRVPGRGQGLYRPPGHAVVRGPISPANRATAVCPARASTPWNSPSG